MPSVDQHAHRGGVAQTAAGGEGVGEVLIGRIAGPIAAAIPPWAMKEFDARSEPLVTSVTVAPVSGRARAP